MTQLKRPSIHANKLDHHSFLKMQHMVETMWDCLTNVPGTHDPGFMRLDIPQRSRGGLDLSNFVFGVIAETPHTSAPTVEINTGYLTIGTLPVKTWTSAVVNLSIGVNWIFANYEFRSGLLTVAVDTSGTIPASNLAEYKLPLYKYTATSAPKLTRNIIAHLGIIHLPGTFAP